MIKGNLLTEATRDSVENIDERYDGYHSDLILAFSRIIQILREEPSSRAQNRAIEVEIRRFSDEALVKRNKA